LKPIDLATSSNRDLIIRVALQRYNSNISLFPPRSWIAYCKMCKRLVNFGFDFTITPIPLLKSKSFSTKCIFFFFSLFICFVLCCYFLSSFSWFMVDIEEDMDNLAIDSDEVNNFIILFYYSFFFPLSFLIFSFLFFFFFLGYFLSLSFFLFLVSLFLFNLFYFIGFRWPWWRIRGWAEWLRRRSEAAGCGKGREYLLRERVREREEGEK